MPFKTVAEQYHLQDWATGLRCLFPTTDALDAFEKDNPDVLPKFLNLLASRHVIENSTRAALESKIASTHDQLNEMEAPADETFEELIQNHIDIYKSTYDDHFDIRVFLLHHL